MSSETDRITVPTNGAPRRAAERRVDARTLADADARATTPSADPRRRSRRPS